MKRQTFRHCRHRQPACTLGDVITRPSFFSLYRHGFARVACCTIHTALAEPARNAQSILDAARRCDARGAALAVFPELSLSGYAIDDLLLQDALLDAVERSIEDLVADTGALSPLLLIGAPIRWRHRLYNCAIAIHRGRILGIVPKTHLPNYREFYEKRHFASGAGVQGDMLALAGQTVPFGPDLIFSAEDLPGFRIGVEICEDLWVPVPPSSLLALNGASVLANLSASPVTIGRAASRRHLCRSQSMRCLAAYAYTATSVGESTNDLAWDGHALIFEHGELLAESTRFASDGQITMADIDLDRLRQERARMGSFDDNARDSDLRPVRDIAFTLDPPAADLGLERCVARFPFVPADTARLAQDCHEAYEIQVAGLVQRIRASHAARLVIGISGGLDSTQALIVCARAMDRLGRDRSQVLAAILPGLATSDGTMAKARAVASAMGAETRVIDIGPASRQMLHDLDHPYARGEAVYDTVFENVQAGLRTDYLFRLANAAGGIVVGTGDLSELALGWCTYGVGDQMAHYNVNAGVPKTLIQHLIRWAAASGLFEAETNALLTEIVAAEISPELVPAGPDGAVQSTEALIGPYALQDFTLFHVLRYGFLPSKIAFLCWHAWQDRDAGSWPPHYPDAMRRAYDLTEIRQWMKVFLHRFFEFSQFKRSAMPNGPKVVAGGSLSPRGEWRAPSDALAAVWLADAGLIPDQ